MTEDDLAALEANKRTGDDLGRYDAETVEPEDDKPSIEDRVTRIEQVLERQFGKHNVDTEAAL